MNHRRIVVAGTSGSGKTTLARRISRELGIPHIELDAIHHQPGWTPMPEREFRAAVAERITAGAWVTDGNYRNKLGDLLWRSADTVVWSICRRTLGRVLTPARGWCTHTRDMPQPLTGCWGLPHGELGRRG
ncbi:AAA family ATPase [Nocardia vaccinii]|uniref:AAA family ATPase n=1 Tax=Nocardia vaccinii TaxID=1822 RepID=UPI000A5B9CCD|nr:AAA family ATPase [Nocardia vaccinii]